MNKEDRQAQARLIRLGIDPDDAYQLHLIERRLRRWFCLECGDGNQGGSWAIERDENGDGKPYMVHHHYFHGKRPDYVSRTLIRDAEKSALKKLAGIMANYPELVEYVQGDPRGCALYILRRDQIRPDQQIGSMYSNGVAV